MSENTQPQNGFDVFKQEVATKLGVPEFYSHDKGEYPSRINGFIGGNSVRSLQHLAREYLMSITPEVAKEFIDKYGLDVIQSDIDKTQEYLNKYSS